MVEISCHGGALVTKKILKTVLESGARLAEPGEFSKRAFLNGRIDLVQAEAIIDIIRSRSDRGWKTAFSQLDGKLSDRLNKLEEGFVKLLTDIEAGIDFPDEGFIEDTPAHRIEAMERILKEIAGLISSYDTGRVYREGFTVTIAGRPNVGKSSLMNALLERDRMIVTDTPGATRDTVEEVLQIEGVAVKIIDTAGVRESSDDAEVLGIRRSLEAVEESDLTLLVFDGSEKLTDEDKSFMEGITVGRLSSEIITVINKADLSQTVSTIDLEKLDCKIVPVSAKSGDGVSELKAAIVDTIIGKGETFGEGPVVTRERHFELLRAMGASTKQAITVQREGMSTEFIAADLREAQEALGELTGKSVTDAVIDKIFNEFCIGK